MTTQPSGDTRFMNVTSVETWIRFISNDEKDAADGVYARIVAL